MLKNIIKNLISTLGYSLVKIDNISDAISYNDLDTTNDFYRSNNKVDKYYSAQRLKSFLEIFSYIDIDINMPDKYILDAGCGAGYFSNFLSKKLNKAKLYGIDFSDQAINYARNKYSHIQFDTKNIEEKLDETYDLICTISVLEHLKYPDVVFKNLLNSLNKGGTIITVVPNGRVDNFNGHIHFWSIESWSLFLEQHAPNCTIKSVLLKEKPDILSVIYKY